MVPQVCRPPQEQTERRRLHHQNMEHRSSTAKSVVFAVFLRIPYRYKRRDQAWLTATLRLCEKQQVFRLVCARGNKYTWELFINSLSDEGIEVTNGDILIQHQGKRSMAMRPTVWYLFEASMYAGKPGSIFATERRSTTRLQWRFRQRRFLVKKICSSFSLVPFDVERGETKHRHCKRKTRLQI